MKKRRGYVSYRRRRRRKRAIIIAAVVAAALMAVGAVLLWGGDAESESEKPAGKPAATEPAADKEIVTGQNAPEEEEVPNYGTVRLNTGLERGLREYSGRDVLYHVSMSLFQDIDKEFRYNGKTLDEYYSDPINALYQAEYEKWHEEVYVPMDREMTAAEERGEEHAQGWWKHDVSQLFREYWEETQPESVRVEQDRLSAQQNMANNAYHEWLDSEELEELRLEYAERECARLNSLGYELSVKYGEIGVKELEGYLTAEQIRNFDAAEDVGYIIRWAKGRTEE